MSVHSHEQTRNRDAHTSIGLNGYRGIRKYFGCHKVALEVVKVVLVVTMAPGAVTVALEVETVAGAVTVVLGAVTVPSDSSSECV